jgi:hypothetical protein
MTRTTTFIFSLIIIVLLLVGAWWYFFFEKGTSGGVTNQNNASSTRPGFSPLNPSTPAPQTNPETPTGTSTGTVSEPSVAKIPKIRKLYATPVATGIVGSSTASSTSVFFVDRGTGHVYNAEIATEKPTKLSNTTILRVYESLFDANGKNVLMRYIKEGAEIVTTVYAPVREEIKAKFVSNNTSSIAISPKGDLIFTLEQTNTGSIGYISKLDGTAKAEIFNSPLREWIATWPEEGTVTLTTKANRLSPGYLFFLNTKTGGLTKILGPLNGLTTNTSRDAKKVLYSISVAGRVENRVLTVADGSNQNTLFQTLPEKCVWGNIKKTSLYCAVSTEPLKNLPDDWYKGLTKGVDQIWHLDTVTNDVYKVSNLFSETGVSIDAINLTLDPKEQGLFFINYNDLSLWSIDLVD